MRLANPVSKKVFEVRIKAAIFGLSPTPKALRESTGLNLRGSDPSPRQNAGSHRFKQGLCGQCIRLSPRPKCLRWGPIAHGGHILINFEFS